MAGLAAGQEHSQGWGLSSSPHGPLRGQLGLPHRMGVRSKSKHPEREKECKLPWAHSLGLDTADMAGLFSFTELRSPASKGETQTSLLGESVVKELGGKCWKNG